MHQMANHSGSTVNVTDQLYLKTSSHLQPRVWFHLDSYLVHEHTQNLVFFTRIHLFSLTR